MAIGGALMTDSAVSPKTWADAVDEIVCRYAEADADEFEEICIKIAANYGAEAADEVRAKWTAARSQDVGEQTVIAPKPPAKPKAIQNLLAKVKAEHQRAEAAKSGAAKSPEPVLLPAVIESEAQSEILVPSYNEADHLVQLMNQKHAVIGNYGNRCAVMSWERWNVDTRQLVPTFQNPADFKNRYANKSVELRTDKGTKYVPAGHYWFTNPRRVTYEAISFEPSEPKILPGNRLNLWQGFAVKPQKGSWRLTRRHIYRVLGNGDRQAGRYIIRWLAWMFQNPGRPAEAVLVFQGEEGAGKGTLAKIMIEIFGIASLPISNPKLLTGQFSGHLQHCVFLFLDEAFWAGDRTAEGRLKSLVTENTITIEPKYFGAFQIRNCLHIMMASNNDWVVPAGHGARRYAVFKVSSARVDDFDYFNAINAELKAGGIAAMLYDLLRLDLGNWHPKQIYKTAALAEQKQHSLRGLDAWIEAMLQEGIVPRVISSKYPNRCLSADLLESAKEYDQYANASRVTRKLKELFGMEDFNVQVARGWAFPPLAECRKTWERRNGGHWQWNNNLAEWRLC
jgi:hypothetical protein